MVTKLVRHRWFLLATFCVVGLNCIVGCGGVRRVPVSGTVTLDNQPLNGGFLEFNPDVAKGNKNQIIGKSRIQDGRYTLETSGISRSDSGDGVPLGWYKVTWRILEESTKKRKVEIPNVPAKYKSVETTPLFVEVKDNPDPGAYDFKMTK